MKLIDFIERLKTFLLNKTNKENSDDIIVKRIIQSRSNVITQNDVDKLWDEVKNYNFTK